MESKVFICPCMFVFVFVLLGCCSFSCLAASDGGSGPTVPMPCMQKLIPCQPYLKGNPPPPSPCCVPLKMMISEDPTCLCSILNDPPFLSNLNITQDDALNLAKACGSNPDVSVCKKVGVAPIIAPSSPSNSTHGPTSNTTGSASKKSAAVSIKRAAGSFVSLVMGVSVLISWAI